MLLEEEDKTYMPKKFPKPRKTGTIRRRNRAIERTSLQVFDSTEC